MSTFYFGTSTPDFADHYDLRGPTNSACVLNTTVDTVLDVPVGGITINELCVGMESSPGQAGATIKVGVYDITAGAEGATLIAQATVNSRTDNAGYVWHTTTGLSITVPYVSGKKIALAVTPPTADIWITGQGVDTDYFSDGTSETTLPSTWSTTGLGRVIPIRAGYESGASVVAPTYTGNFTANVAENTTAVGTYPVTTNGGGTITYTITGTDVAKFSVNSSTGQVAFLTAPDYEVPTDVGTDNVYNINIVGTNSAGNASATLTITVTNVADVPPTVSGTLALNVAENTASSATIATITPSAGTAPFTYSLTGADANKFTVNSTGDLKFATAPDFEVPTDTGTNNVYNVNVVVTNAFGNATTVTTVTVTDVNEVITLPGVILQLRDIGTAGLPWIPNGTSVDIIIYADGSPDVVVPYTIAVTTNGTIRLTDAAWTVGATKNAVVKVGSTLSQAFTFTVADV